MNRIISSFLCFVIVLTALFATPFTVSAATAPSGTYGTDYAKYGDVNLDNSVNSLDALFALKNSVNKLTLEANKKGPADVTFDGKVTSDDALSILKYSVELTDGFSEEYIIDKVGGGTNGASADAVPDKYQKKITFKVANGTWSDNKTADIVTYKTLMSSGKYSTSGTASLSAPTGMVRSYGYTGGAWNTTVPTSVSGNAAVTYTYSFARMSVNYTVEHYRISTYSTYPSTPTTTETKSGYVGDTVTAAAKTYTGYSVDTSKSTSSKKLEETNNVLKVYYSVAASNNISTYSKTNAVNGAYTKDSSADTSFSANITSLKPYTLYYVTEAALHNSSGKVDNDYMRLFYSVQGLVNRDFGMDAKHTTAIYSYAQGGTETTWLNYIQSNSSILRKSSAAEIGDGLTQINITTWDSFYSIFKDVIKACGIVLWDGNVPATANVAATICGLDGYIPVLAKSPLHDKLIKDGVSVKLDLVGKFVNGKKGTNISGTSVKSTGSAKNDAYLWALEKYMNRCSTSYMAYMLDGAVTLLGYSAYPDHASAKLIKYERWKQLYNHDYFIARRAFFFDLNPYAGEAATDDPAQVNGQADKGTDVATLKKIFAKRYSRAGGAFGHLIGFPPWWAKYSKDFSLGSQPATTLEWLFTEIITCYNLAKEADAAGMTAMTNGSIYYKYVPKTSKYTNNTTPLENLTYNANTYYYTIYVGDYDSSAWVKTIMPGNFSDSKRGTIPLMWSVNPNLSYRIPMAFDYMYEKKTAKDYFAGGDGGAGYIIPEALFHDKVLAYAGEKRPAGNAAAGTVWANYSKTFYQRFGYEMTGFIINGAQYKVTLNMASSISAYSPKLNFTNCSQSLLAKHNSTYFVYCQNGVDVGNQDVMYNHANMVKSQGINFGAYRTVTLSPTKISQIVSDFATYASSKGMTVKYVDPYTYYNLLKSSGKGQTVSTQKTLISGLDSTSNVTTAFETRVAIETGNKQEGSGALWLGFDNVAGNVSTNQIGGMAKIEFTTPLNLSSCDDLSIDLWTSYAIEGSAAVQINFVTNGNDDGYNFLIDITGKQPGWHTLKMTCKQPNIIANNADWSSIRAIRITYFNYDGKTSPNFLMFDNLQGIVY